jgi:hypothetical protein
VTPCAASSGASFPDPLLMHGFHSVFTNLASGLGPVIARDVVCTRFSHSLREVTFNCKRVSTVTPSIGTLAVNVELPGKRTREELKGVQRELVVQFNQLGNEESGSSLPLRSAGYWSSPPISPLARTQLNSPLEVVKRGNREEKERRATPLPPSTAGMCEVGHGCGCVQACTYTAYSRELVYAKSSTSRWIASRSRKLSGRSCVEGCCASAPSGCGCVARRHNVQSVLPGALATALEQPCF